MRERHLRIFEDRSELITPSGSRETFREGKLNDQTKQRTKEIKDSFANGFFEKLIVEVKENQEPINIDQLNKEVKKALDILVDSVTSEMGRALVGLTIMQLSIKTISPTQNIRLHKGSSNKSSFSWVDGISMRVLDKNYVTPVLRKFNLVKLNADGFMMTRSLAENYPYTLLYKAQLRGAKQEWLNIVELLESGKIDSLMALKYLISLLFNKASDFEDIAQKTIDSCKTFLEHQKSLMAIKQLIQTHIDESDYAARLMEVAMHSLMQAAVESGAFGSIELKPLSQMRSANKKHGNIGDIELLENHEIIEAWDAKYGKDYLRDEIDEVSEKLVFHEQVELVGFVTTEKPKRDKEITNKIADIKALYELEVQILTFTQWVKLIFGRVIETDMITEEKLAENWLTAYVESLAQKRRTIAPIDEPCFEWINLLCNKLES